MRARLVIPMFLLIAARGPHCNGDISAPHVQTPSGISRINIFPASVAADGASLVAVSVIVTPDANSAPANITVTSSTGSFPAAAASTFTGIADESDSIVAWLKVGRDTGVFSLRAVAGANSASRTIHLTSAYPQQLTLSAGALIVGSKASISISVALIRSPGLVTRGTPVLVALQRADLGTGAPLGSVDGPVATDSVGNATAHYTGGIVSTADSVWLVATADSGDPARPLMSRVKIYIAP